MPKYKLTYFNFAGLGEPIRYLLSYMGEDFEDVRISREEWPAIKKSSKFGRIPNLEIDGEVFCQSLAISRYLATLAGLTGKTPLEDLYIDQAASAVGDIREEIRRYALMADPEIKEQYKEALINDIIPLYFQQFEKLIEENNGFLANGKLSWADLYFIGFSETLPQILPINLTEEYPHYRALRNEVQSLPGIKDWIEKMA